MKKNVINKILVDVAIIGENNLQCWLDIAKTYAARLLKVQQIESLPLVRSFIFNGNYMTY
jgi:hypothetical protein